MKNYSRRVNALRNALFSGGVQLFTIIARFVIQTIFIWKLGKTYTGINSLFNSIILLLNLSELGIGGVISYSLYKQLAVGDEQKISGLMNFYQQIYHLLAKIIFLSGLIVIPFLPILVKDQSVPYLSFIFLLYLLNTVSSYFFSYKRALLTADQRDYLNQRNLFIFSFGQYALQIVILLFFGNFIAYLLVFIATQLIANLLISLKVDQLYPFLKENRTAFITTQELKEIKTNTLEIVGVKLSDVVVLATDSLLLSSVLGIRIVAIYSNYDLIRNAVNKLFQMMIGGATASVGNFVHDQNDLNKAEQLYYHHFKITFLFGSIAFLFMLGAMPSFILLWAGKSYLASPLTVWLISLNLGLQIMRNTPQAFFQATGTFKHLGVKSIIEAVFNLFLSLLLLKLTNLGIAAVVLGTLMANLIINSWWEHWQIYRRYFKKSVRNFLIQYYARIVFLIACGFLQQLILKSVSVSSTFLNLLFALLISFIFCVILMLLFNLEQIKLISNQIFKK